MGAMQIMVGLVAKFGADTKSGDLARVRVRKEGKFEN